MTLLGIFLPFEQEVVRKIDRFAGDAQRFSHLEINDAERDRNALPVFENLSNMKRMNKSR